MAVQADLQFRLSGGPINVDPALAIGGAKSVASMGAVLFDDVTPDERTAGRIEYRCVYLHNNSTDTLATGAVWIQTNTANPMTHCQLGLGLAAAGVDEATVANETTAPAGVVFFDAAPAGALAVQALGPGQSKALWIKREVQAGAGASTDTIELGWYTPDVTAGTVTPHVIQLGASVQTWAPNQTKTITFAQPLSLGSTVVVGIAAGNYLPGATSPVPSVASIYADWVSFGEPVVVSLWPGSALGLMLYLGTVNGPGATAVEIRTELECFIAGGAFEVGSLGTPQVATTASAHSDQSTTTTVTTPTTGTLPKANALAVLLGYSDNYNGVDLGWAAPAGWTPVAIQPIANTESNILMAIKTIDSTAQFSTTVTTAEPDQYGRIAAIHILNGT